MANTGKRYLWEHNDSNGDTALDLSGGSCTTTNLSVTNDLTMSDAGNIIVNATTGSQIATATSQKLAFFGSTPVAQQSLTVTTVATTNSVSTTSAIWGFSTSTQANQIIVAIDEVLQLLANLGLAA